MNRDRIQSIVPEILHPVMLLMLAGPMFYALFEARVDRWVLPLYLAGLCLLPLSAAVRAAADRISSMWIFLLLTGAGMAVILYAVPVIAGTAFPALPAAQPGPEAAEAVQTDLAASIPSGILRAECLLGGTWLIFSALRLRLRENRRARAWREKDTSWRERPLLAEKPTAPCLAWFVLGYGAGLMNACPVLCDTALAAGTVYLFMYLYYRAASVTGRYLEETQRLANVPRNKLRGIRRKMLALLLILLCAAAVPAVLTRGSRHYSDLRKWEWEVVPMETETEGQTAEGDGPEALAELLGDDGPLWEPPAWLITLGKVLSAVLVTAVLAGVLLSVWRSILTTAGDFADRPEENGDISRRIRGEEEEEGTAAGRLRQLLRGRPRTERERIRQTYRRTIRRYRKERPGRSETPAEIESGTDFPQGFDREALHAEYERARYGS